MADNVVLNAGGGGDTIAADDIAGVKHQLVKLEFGGDGEVVAVSPAAPLPTGLVLVTPRTRYAVAGAVAAGAQADLDSDPVAVGTTGQLVALSVAASVPFQASLHIVSGAAAGPPKAMIFGQAGQSAAFVIPAKSFFTVAAGGAGFDGFRTRVTNLDSSHAADLHATFFWDEV